MSEEKKWDNDSRFVNSEGGIKVYKTLEEAREAVAKSEKERISASQDKS
jgi:hypothetical protein